MCGFIGCISNDQTNQLLLEQETFKRMTDLIRHRGPDDEGFFIDYPIQFGYRYFDTGTGLPTYENDRYWIIFNGKIFNSGKLRDELTKKGLTFETDTEAEIVMTLYSEYREKTVEMLRGAFALIIWDKEKQELFGARDPFGLKPFYYKEDEIRTYFASEEKSILEALEEIEFNYEALQQYMTYQFVPEPHTLIKGIKKLEPGHYFYKKSGQPIEIYQYWKASFHPINKSEDEFIQQIRDVLFDSVEVHMQSDVPVGSFLSGGIDSSFLVSIAKMYDPKIKTFSVGFEREGYSEIDVAKETAEKLGVENISYVVSPEEYMRELPKIIWHLDDPLADPACVPLYFVSREASKHVSIALSGEGSDELFGGYNIYREPQSLEIFQKFPGSVKQILKAIARIIPEGVKGKSFIERGVTPLEERYIGNAKMFEEEEKQKLLKVYNDSIHYTDITKTLYEETVNYDPVNRMQYIDLHTWMRGDILLKADRMTMAHSIEVRSPFLDKKVFDVASQIPTSLKTAEGTTKYILRKAAEGIVPDHVLHRKKLGFPVPIRHWLKDEMYDWAKDIIYKSGTNYLINKQYVSQLLEDHAQGKRDYSRKIWTVLIFMIWHAVFVEEQYDFEAEKKKAVAHS